MADIDYLVVVPEPVFRIAQILGFSVRTKVRRSREAQCPTPTKIAYAQRHEAEAALSAILAKRGNRECRIYGCNCGSFHLTSKPGWYGKANLPRG